MTATDFIGRICLKNNDPPIRAYVHRAGYIEAYNNDIQEANRHLTQVLKENRDELKHFQYILASMWGEGKDKMIDMFGYRAINEWPGNPEIHGWVMENGIFVPVNKIMSEKGLTCEDTTIMLSKEAEHRRIRKDLDDFISNPPHFSPAPGDTRITIIPYVKKD